MSRLREAAQQAIGLICSARLSEANSMSSRREMLRLMTEATDTLRAALAEPVQEPSVPETNFWHMVPVGWLENPFGSFRRNWLWKLDPPPKTLAWSIPLYAAPSQPAEPVQSTPWAHLPNAAHIDRILAQLAAHPDTWDEARVASWYANRDAAWVATRGIALNKALSQALAAAREAAWDATWVAVRGVARVSTRDAIAALIAWDEAGELLSLPIDAVKAMADEGNHAAILIYPAMLAMREDK